MTVEDINDTTPNTIELPQINRRKGKKATGLLGKSKINMYKIFKRGGRTSSTTPEAACNSTDISDALAANQTFEENLKQLRFSKASEQLIALERSLFGQCAEARADQQEKLESDYEALFNQIWLAVDGSLKTNPEELEVLQQAITAIQQEEEQDRWWKDPDQAGKEDVPMWRPRKARAKHDSLLEALVRARLEHVDDVSGAEGLSSLKQNIFKMGKRLQEDLLKVIRDVKGCYPKEFDICNVYAKLYHQAFQTQLTTLIEFQLDIEDAVYILSWVHDHYPRDILQNDKLKLGIDTEALGCLLPEKTLEPLQELYLSFKESKMKEWASAALSKEEKLLMEDSPKIQDGWYSTDIAIDVIQLFHLAAREARTILGDMDKAKRIMGQLKVFLMSYKMLLEEVIKGKRGKPGPALKAHLCSLGQFKRYIMESSELLTTEVQENCLTILEEVTWRSHVQLTAVAHKELKSKYNKLCTGEWLAGNNPDVVEELEKHIDILKMNLRPECHEKLLGHMHREVMVEYVRRLMKRKLKLSNKAQQEKAAALLCQDNERLHTLFTEAGSKEEWLRNILPKIADVLCTHDLQFIQLEVVTLVRDYPDIRSHHISALLSIKYNLSNDDINKVKKSVKENRSTIESAKEWHDFFSMVVVKHRYL